MSLPAPNPAIQHLPMNQQFTFLVQHGDFSATLILSSKWHTLRDLAETIIRSVNFEMDHAYGFYDNLKNPHRSKEEYTLFADLGEDSKPGDKGVKSTALTDVFKTKKKMLFLFDYGDDWCFLVTCQSIEDTSSNFRKPKILAPKGELPIQYPDYDEDEDE